MKSSKNFLNGSLQFAVCSLQFAVCSFHDWNSGQVRTIEAGAQSETCRFGFGSSAQSADGVLHKVFSGHSWECVSHKSGSGKPGHSLIRETVIARTQICVTFGSSAHFN